MGVVIDTTVLHISLEEDSRIVSDRLSAWFVQDRADSGGQIVNRKGLLDEIDPFVQNAMVQDHIVRVTGHVKHFQIGVSWLELQE